MNAYEAKKAARIERMRARADRLAGESEGSLARARATADRIPFGQPILVGHHSERRHRKDLARIDSGFRKGFELAEEASELARRADRAEASDAVSSDDPEAVAKMREKLAEAEAAVVATKAANKLLRASAHPPTAEVITKVAELFAWSPDRVASRLGILHSMGQKTFSTTNEAANVRRIKGRIAELEKRATTPAREPKTFGAIRVEEADNRVRVIFPGKPSDLVRDKLKGAGFRWAPSEGAWQRHPSYWAWQEACTIAERANELAEQAAKQGACEHISDNQGLCVKCSALVNPDWWEAYAGAGVPPPA